MLQVVGEINLIDLFIFSKILAFLLIHIFISFNSIHFVRL